MNCRHEYTVKLYYRTPISEAVCCRILIWESVCGNRWVVFALGSKLACLHITYITLEWLYFIGNMLRLQCTCVSLTWYTIIIISSHANVLSLKNVYMIKVGENESRNNIIAKLRLVYSTFARNTTLSASPWGPLEALPPGPQTLAMLENENKYTHTFPEPSKGALELRTVSVSTPRTVRD